MDHARIAELLEPFLSTVPNPYHAERSQRRSEEPVAILSGTLLKDISTYIDLLLRWNARINLTAIRDPEEIVTRHFGESFFAARHLFPGAARVGTAAPGGGAKPSFSVHVADLGSGAGFPGIPIKLWAPHVSMTLIESNQKKATFLREVVRSLRLTDVDIQNTRGEDLLQTYDVVTLRAVERFTQALQVAARILAPNGRLALLIAASQTDDALLAIPRFTWEDPIPIPQSSSRLLLMSDPVSMQ